MAELLAVKGENRFKIQAFEKGARTVESVDRPLAEILAGGGTKALMALPGIGAGIAAKIEELLSKGTCREYDQLRKSLPPGIEELLQVPNLGPKTAMLVARNLKVRNIADLEKAIAAHKVAALPRVGEKHEAKILKGIAILKTGQSRMPLGRALPLANDIEAALKAFPGVAQVARAGSLRRMKDTIGDLDFLVTPRSPRDAAGIIAAFASLPQVGEVLVQGETKCSVRLENGFQADLRVVPKESFGAALHYFTGSKAHNIMVRELGVKKGLSINEYGVHRGKATIGGEREEDVFKAVGLPFIPPELREGTGEIEAAKAGRLPRLIEAADLKGDLHMHSKWSDGSDTIRAMAEGGRALGYEYVALCDHSRVLKMARGLSIEDLRKKNREIDALNKVLKGIRVLKGAEVDILEDGSLDYPDDVLAELEVVVISVHSRFNLDEAAQTRRICRALGNRYATLLAHPTGRLIGERDPYAVNLGTVIKAAKDHGKCLELNAQVKRLDLTDTSVRRARDAGVTIAINTDSHAKEQLPLGRTYGIGIARRGWLEAGDVLNTLPLPGLLKRLGRRG
jgi:DNA polymerase (family 10)